MYLYNHYQDNVQAQKERRKERKKEGNNKRKKEERDANNNYISLKTCSEPNF